MQDPLDINHPQFHDLKQHWAVKIVWLRKLLGQDTGWFDQWSTGKVDPWKKMLDSDVNNQITVTSISKDK